ncbi:27 kDa hemolymph protein-like [Leguminivora glycinivorella]|uniref:27 kDa hemolymph protein-like n=1 Tax=Leguminivora glycinivorella TaxID=1035111 RepID=UPI00200FBBAD|nr:27 kDa hemolymph protein-like [Leguminivora glycinivorella]
MLRYVFVVVLAVGVLGEYQVTEEHKQQVKNAIEEVCKKANAEDKATEVQNAINAFSDCLKGLFNVDQIKAEIEEAKPNGALDEVFKKYCAKSSQLKTCINTAITGVTPCVPTEYRVHLPAATNTTDQLIDFVCYKDGDRIALFIAEKGPECFTEKLNDMKACAETLKDSVGSVEAAKALSTEEKCKKLDALSACVVTKLEACENPTPANMVESLYKFIKKASPCNTK